MGVTLLTLFGGKIASFIGSLFSADEAVDENTEKLKLQNEELEKLAENWETAARAVLSTDEVLGRLATVTQKSGIALSELRNSISDLQSQLENFTEENVQEISFFGEDPAESVKQDANIAKE